MDNIIKSFLVGLGFSVDDSSLASFNKAVLSATLKVTALYTSTQIMAAGIVKGIASISESFEDMGYEYRLISPAINKALILRQELLKAYSAAGINIQNAIVSSIKLNLSLTKTKFAMEAIYKSVGSKFFGLLTKQSDLFRNTLYKNMPKIQDLLHSFVVSAFKAFDATWQLGQRIWSILSRIYDFFSLLNKATDGWSGIILSVIAAWKLLNLSFLQTPLGQLLAGLLAILALYDDFKTFEEGGKSFFNWTNALPVINAVKKALESIVDVIGNIGLAFYQLYKGDFSGFFDSVKNSALSLFDVLKGIWDIFSSIGAFLDKFIDKNLGTNLQNNPTAQPLVNPIGSSVSTSQVNQNVNQQTQINVVGSADANATGRAVSNQQSRVNFDLTRNMKGIAK